MKGFNSYGFVGDTPFTAEVNEDAYRDTIVRNDEIPKGIVYIYTGSKTFAATPCKALIRSK